MSQPTDGRAYNCTDPLASPNGMRGSCSSISRCVFSSVNRTLHLPADWVAPANHDYLHNKEFLRPRHWQERWRATPCVAYAAGIAGYSTFEKELGKECEVHAFDCTVRNGSRSSRGPFVFHPVCIGEPTNAARLAESLYARRSPGTNGQPSEALVFRPLPAILAELGHTQLHVLKLDVEGGEWDILRSELLARRVRPPFQLLFELHTRHSNPKYVPRSLVADKGKTEVDALFADLHALGYRVFGKHVNFKDLGCSEFSLLLVDEAAAGAASAGRGDCRVPLLEAS